MPIVCPLYSVDEIYRDFVYYTKQITFAPSYGFNGQLPYDYTPENNEWGDLVDQMIFNLNDSTYTYTAEIGQDFRFSAFYLYSFPRIYINPFEACPDPAFPFAIHWNPGNPDDDHFIIPD